MRSRNYIKGGFVYIMKNSNNEFKIGSTNNVKNRLSNIKCGCPSVELLFKSDVLSNRVQVESAIHKELKSYNSGGEWFNCSEGTAVSVVTGLISSIGIVINKGQTVDLEEFESDLEWSKIQATGVLCKSHSDRHRYIIDRYMSYLEVRCLRQLSWFTSLSPSEQFLQAATVLAATFISKEKELIDKVQGKLNFNGEK